MGHVGIAIFHLTHMGEQLIQHKLGETGRIYIVSNKSKTFTFWWNTFSQALERLIIMATIS